MVIIVFIHKLLYSINENKYVYLTKGLACTTKIFVQNSLPGPRHKHISMLCLTLIGIKFL